MNLEMTIYRTAHAYPGGLRALADAMQIRYASLKHKVSPTYVNAHLSPMELAMLIELAGAEPLHALCSGARHVAMPLPDEEGGDDECVVNELAEAMHGAGKFATTTTRSYSDRKFTAVEIAAMERDALESIAANTRVVAAARRVFDQGRVSPDRRASAVKSDKGSKD